MRMATSTRGMMSRTNAEGGCRGPITHGATNSKAATAMNASMEALPQTLCSSSILSVHVSHLSLSLSLGFYICHAKGSSRHMALLRNRYDFCFPTHANSDRRLLELQRPKKMLRDCEIRRMSLRLKPIIDEEAEAANPSTNESAKKQVFDLGNGSEILYIPRFVSSDQGWSWFEYLDKQIPWTRPAIRVFGRSVIQPRDTCYVASSGLPELIYSGYRPAPFSWDDFPPLRDILDAVHKLLPRSSFNSLLLNRYKCGSDYVAWHSDDEKLYGVNHDIASLSLGCEREFLLRCKQKPERRKEEEPASKRSKKSSQYSFMLKHGSLLVMKGYTQRDWIHSIPKRAKAESIRINLTFRRVLEIG